MGDHGLSVRGEEEALVPAQREVRQGVPPIGAHQLTGVVPVLDALQWAGGEWPEQQDEEHGEPDAAKTQQEW